MKGLAEVVGFSSYAVGFGSEFLMFWDGHLVQRSCLKMNRALQKMLQKVLMKRVSILMGRRRGKEVELWLSRLIGAEEALLDAAYSRRDFSDDVNNKWVLVGSNQVERIIRALLASSVEVALSFLAIDKCIDSLDYASDRHVASLMRLIGQREVADSILENAWVLARNDGIPDDKEIRGWFFGLSRLDAWYKERDIHH